LSRRDEARTRPDRRAHDRSSSSPSEDLRTLRRAFGAALDQRFLRERSIARGGMGQVDLIRDRVLERSVARKTLLPELHDSPDAVGAFLREARLTARLQHPNIVTVHDLDLGDESGPSFTMEHVEGRTLADLIIRHHAEAAEAGPDAHAEGLADLLEIVLKVCDALALAHDEGVLHRDVKPENVMVGDYGQVYLMDWGIALERRPGGGTQSVGGTTVVGTLAYMAPEIVAGEPAALDVRTDVYSVGALLHEVLTGWPPRHDVGELATRLEQVRQGESQAQELEEGPDRPAELVRLIRRATAPRREDRHDSVLELQADLRRFLRGGGALPRVEVSAGAAVVREGESGDAAFVILSGRCDVRRRSPGGERSLRVLEAGEVFGETALLAPGPRTATVVALEDCRLVRVTAEALEREVSALKPWLGSLLRGMARVVREAWETERAEADQSSG
jgi:serine/threonine-protein kinase